jgi:microcystin-dependent protein
MTLHVTHLFVSPKTDGPDSTLVRPSAASGGWNADHKLVTDSTAPIVLGRQTAGAGAIEELPISVIFPTGVVVPFAGAAAPAGWLLCFGQSLIQVDYAALFAVIGQTYGAGPGPSTFLLPDLRGAAVGGKSNMGGADRGNMPGGAVLGQYLGAPTGATGNIHSTGVNNINFGSIWFTQSSGSVSAASGGISYQPGGSGLNFVQINDAVAVSGYTTINANFTLAVDGSSAAFNIVQPTVMLNYIIKI